MAQFQQPSNSNGFKFSVRSALSCACPTVRHALLALLFVMRSSYASCLGSTPRSDIAIFGAESVSPAILARSANKLIEMGEDRAMRLLLAPEGLLNEDGSLCYQVRDRSAWMLRLLYEADKGKTIRSPAFGALDLPQRSMPQSEWPHFPLVISKDVLFVLAEGYTVLGLPESLEDYATYCQRNGIFRIKPYVVPTEKEAQAGLDALLTSQRWKAIEWKLVSPSIRYSFGRQRVQLFLEAQVDANADPTVRE